MESESYSFFKCTGSWVTTLTLPLTLNSKRWHTTYISENLCEPADDVIHR
jgi:hypothetical protein